MSNPPITNTAKPEDLKTRSHWDQLGRDVIGRPTHYSKSTQLWHINHTQIRTKRNQS